MSQSPRDRDPVARYVAAHPVRKLHIGCGDNLLPGWLNADRHPFSDAVLPLDAARVFPLPDAGFDYVFSEHLIEHLEYRAGLFLLAECRRVLKPGGRIRVATPDLAFLMDLYRRDKSELQASYVEWATASFVPDAPFAADVFVINNFVRAWGHTFLYDEKVLRDSLLRAGFEDVVRCALGASSDPELCGLENESRMPPGFLRLESIVLEARRPRR